MDKINPDHYKTGGVQVIDIIESADLNFNRGNVVKYTCRAGKKSEEGYDALAKELEDMRKALWYASREVTRLENKMEQLNESK
jgi:hypothetical protein